MKKCIWCLELEPKVSFIKDAHTIPKSLGGKHICPEVCDGCNEFFGETRNTYPAVEETIKEAFNISKYRLLNSFVKLSNIGILKGNAKIPKHFTSRYFKVDFDKRKFKIKSSFRANINFQSRLIIQFKKGIYKIILEELQRQKQIAHDEKFEFIRLFCRYGFGDLPVYYFKKRHGIILAHRDLLLNPEVIIDKRVENIIEKFDFFELELFGHKLAVPLNKFNLTKESYFRDVEFGEAAIFKSIIEIKHITDIDLTLSTLD